MKDTYRVLRKWADGKWHYEGEHLTYQKAANLYYRLMDNVIGITANELRIMHEQDIFDVIVSSVEEQTGGIIIPKRAPE